jgi:hypothetical protein
MKLETKLKLSLIYKGVPVKIFDDKNNFIKEFPIIVIVAKYFKISSITVGIWIKIFLIKDLFLNLILKKYNKTD